MDPECLVEGVLFGSGRHLFLFPETERPRIAFDRFLIAWNGSRESARSMAEGMPFLHKAKDVTVAVMLDKRVAEEEAMVGAYHAVPTNFPALRAFHHHVTVSWLRTLQRRSQKDRTTWQRIAKIASDYLPQPTTLHPWPQMRFAVTHPRWEPRAGIPLARFCAGGGR